MHVASASLSQAYFVLRPLDRIGRLAQAARRIAMLAVGADHVAFDAGDLGLLVPEAERVGAVREQRLHGLGDDRHSALPGLDEGHAAQLGERHEYPAAVVAHGDELAGANPSSDGAL